MTNSIIEAARSIMAGNLRGWSFEEVTPWKEYIVVLAYNPEKESGDTGLPIFILVKGNEARYATAQETDELMDLSIMDESEWTGTVEEIEPISEKTLGKFE